ncbi:hypothetical protein BJX76DRAFT_362453 [Aspergillus varians]
MDALNSLSRQWHEEWEQSLSEPGACASEGSVPVSQIHFLTTKDGWRPQQVANHIGSTLVQYTREDISGAATNPSATESGTSTWNTSPLSTAIPWPHETSIAWNWMWKELKDFLPGLPGNGPSSQAMGASLTSLGITTLARARRPDLLSYSEWLRRWAKERVEISFEFEPGATATVIALYGLAISEMVTCDSRDGMHESSIYLDRILVLLSQRKEELENEAELRILAWLKIQIVTELLLRGSRVTNLAPTKTVPDLRTHPSVYIEKLAFIMGRLSCLRADIREYKLRGLVKINRQALMVNEELSNWEQNLLRYFRSESLSPSESPLPWQNDVWTCQIMNSYRCARIIVSGLGTPNISLGSLQALASDIYASQPGSRTATSTYGINQSPIHCMASLWHLALAATTGCKARESIKSCLRIMSERMRIGQSSVLLSIVEHEEDVTEALKRSRFFWSGEDDAQLIDGRNRSESFRTISEQRFGGTRSARACSQRYYHIEKRNQNASRLGTQSLMSTYLKKRSYFWSGEDDAQLIDGQNQSESFLVISEQRFGGTRSARACYQRYYKIQKRNQKTSRLGAQTPMSTYSKKRSYFWSGEHDAQLIDGRSQNESFPTISERRFSGTRSARACYQRYYQIQKRNQKTSQLGAQLPISIVPKKRWSGEDDAQLIDGRNRNESFPTISEQRFGGTRSAKACSQRYQKKKKD